MGATRGRLKIAEPGAALFRGLRASLTLWYSGVLAGVLLACGAVLYFWLEQQLLAPVENRLAFQAEFQARQWQRSGECSPPNTLQPPAPPRLPAPPPSFIVCFTPAGEVVNADEPPPSGIGVPAAFLSPSLVQAAMEEGAATDIVAGGENTGQVYRRAVALSESPSETAQGVLMVGQSIAGQADTLRIVRNLLLGIGVLAVGGSAAGGLILANYAIRPARLAFARQQEFIAEASHELRTPLTLLRSGAELLLRHRSRFEPTDAELLDDIVAETVHMEGLASNLLTLARLDSGSWQPEREVVDLADVAAGVVHRATALAAEKGLTLEEGRASRSLLMGDRQALDQAALILVENAIKYTPPGGSIRAGSEIQGKHAILSVQDTGIGIPPDDLQRLGERFYRVDHARVRASGGAGLGLAIAYRIATAHGGRLEITSPSGEGTRAVLIFPAGV